jgi:hypothetical protein
MELAFFVSFRICDADACDGTGGLGREWGISGDGGFEGLLSNLGGFVIRIRILCILHVSCMYLACILMCPVHIHQDTSRYFKILQDTFVSVPLANIGNVSYLANPRDMYPSLRHLGYI